MGKTLQSIESRAGAGDDSPGSVHARPKELHDITGPRAVTAEELFTFLVIVRALKAMHIGAAGKDHFTLKGKTYDVEVKEFPRQVVIMELAREREVGHGNEG